MNSPFDLPGAPGTLYNERAAARAQMSRAEIYQAVADRLRGTDVPDDPLARAIIVQRAVLQILADRYHLECRLDQEAGR